MTTAVTAAPHAAAARIVHSRLLLNQRRRVTHWVHARPFVPSSNSLASSGAPQNSPRRSGTTMVT